MDLGKYPAVAAGTALVVPVAYEKALFWNVGQQTPVVILKSPGESKISCTAW
jgi:hypothetical protein